MEGHHEYETLVDRGVVTEHGETVALTEEFDATWTETTEELRHEARAELVEALRERLADVSVETLLDICVEDVSRLAGFVALSERMPDEPPDALLGYVLAIEEIRRQPPEDAGAPDAFLPAYPDQLPLFLQLAPRAIVYIWRHDCPPCDLMVEDLDSLFPEPPDDLLLLAVYGPENPELLQERYDVKGGPTTLFVADGTIDLRLHGAQYPEVLENEVERFRELHGTPGD